MTKFHGNFVYHLDGKEIDMSKLETFNNINYTTYVDGRNVYFTTVADTSLNTPVSYAAKKLEEETLNSLKGKFAKAIDRTEKLDEAKSKSEAPPLGHPDVEKYYVIEMLESPSWELIGNLVTEPTKFVSQEEKDIANFCDAMKSMVLKDEAGHWSREKSSKGKTVETVHYNPFNEKDYCAKKERAREAAKGNACDTWHKKQKSNGLAAKSMLDMIREAGKVNPYNLHTKSEEFEDYSWNKEVTTDAGVKESQTTKKAPVFTFCKQMKNAIEQLALRTEYGHNKYLQHDADYNNFARVPNGDEEYGNAVFRHALGLGDDSELDHYVASAWDAIARLEIYLRKEK